MIVTAVLGFLVGWLWYSPLLFAKPWMREMNLTEENMKAAAAKGMAGFFIRGFVYTLISTVALAVLVEMRPSQNIVKGAGIGAFVGLLIVGSRMLNSAVWEQKSAKLMAIVVGHEVVLFTLQGAILAIWP